MAVSYTADTYANLPTGLSGDWGFCLDTQKNYRYAAAWGETGPFASAAILSGSIGSGQVGPYHMASASVTSGKLASGQGHNYLLCSGAVNSGQLASGCLVDYAKALWDSWTTVETVSGVKAVCLTSGNVLALAMAGSGLRLPAIGVSVTNALSGATAVVVYGGKFLTGGTLNATWSGLQGVALYVGSGGMIVGSGLMVSGQRWQRVGVAVSGGLIVNAHPFVTSGLAPGL